MAGELVTGATNVDVFPLDRTQWADSDGDWVGDEQASSRPMVAQMHGEIHNLTGLVALILMAMAGQTQP